MSSASRFARAGLVVGLAASFVPRPAVAAGPSPKAACLAAYEDAQRLRLASKLVAAREQLRVCRADVCPALVRNECEKWLGEVAESLPSVVLSARDPSGRDLLDVTVSVDGARVPALDGKAFDVDPGSHTFRFQRGKEVKEEQWLVRQGEHNRVIVGVLGEPPRAPAPAAAPSAREPGPQRTIGLVVGGVGVVGVGVAAALGLASNGDASTLRETCGVDRSCTQDQVDAVVGTRTLAGVVAGFGGAALVTGAVLFLTAPSAERAAAALERGSWASWRAWTWGAAPVPGGLVGGARASF
ncbi:MAG TPA: hypothetical protein PLR99_10880 [Polyangiaceae bacterium]|nr:hypothetical protein [Polyangiaceae bacterium]